MESPYAARSDSLRALYWRKEVLQLLFWMQGEGFGDHLDAGLLERALGVEPGLGLRHLDELVDEGLLDCDGDGRYRLSEAGLRYGEGVVADEFVELVRPGRGERGRGRCGVTGAGRHRPGRDRPTSRGERRRGA